MIDEHQTADIVCFSDITWDYLWQRHQQILTRFPSAWNILFIEPTSLVHLLSEPRRIFVRREGNIIIASLPSLPLTDRVANLRWVNDHLVLIWLRILMTVCSIRSPILLYYEPRYSSLIGKLNERLIVYDCVDDRIAFHGVPPWIIYYIDNLIKKSDILIATSSRLYHKLSEKRKDNVHLVGNGVDIDFFKQAMADGPIPEDILHIKKPIVGYIGVIDTWMDFDLIKALATRCPTISIVLLGPVSNNVYDDVTALKKYKNIFILGKRPYSSLPDYLRAFDACMIPFKINQLTISVNPVKLYEYLAAGRNVVSTDLPELHKYKDIIFLSKNNDEFINKSLLALRTNADIDKFLNVVEKQAWDTKAKKIMSLISTSLGGFSQ